MEVETSINSCYFIISLFETNSAAHSKLLSNKTKYTEKKLLTISI